VAPNTGGEERTTIDSARGALIVPDDTSGEIHRLQGETYRRMGGTARLAIAFELSQMVRRLAIAGIRARHPDYSDADVLHAYARLTLGDDLVRQVWPDRDVIQP
jgi:hypothetical protein